MTNLGKTYKRKTRKFLYENEIEQVIEACNKTPFPLRNKTLILVTYMHAYRAAEVCNLTWKEIDFKNNVISTKGQKGGKDSLQPLWGMEKELLLQLRDQRDTAKYANSNFREDHKYVFTSSRWGTKFEPDNFYKLTMNLGELARFDFPFTPHMLRHSRGTFLANNDVHLLKIRDLLRHVRVSSTELYTHMAANRFKSINDNSIFE